MNKIQILIVDDNQDNIEILKYKLKSASDNYNIQEVNDGNSAIEFVKKGNPDIVLLDINMPDMDGFQAAKLIKNEQKENFIPIIMLTAREDVDSKIKGLDSGADDYLTKPFEVAELHARIKSLIRVKHLQDKISEMNKKLVQSERSAAVLMTVATINHEINNPLCALILDLQLISLSPDFINIPASIKDRLTKIQMSAERIADITKKLNELQEINTTQYVDKSEMIDVKRL